MAQLVGFIVSEDEGFKKQIGKLLRSSSVPVGVVDSIRDGVPPELIVVDVRRDATSGLANIERLRHGTPGAGIFVVAHTADPDLILQSMRAGANEFFVWPPAEETFDGAIRRTASRRVTTQGARHTTTTFAFFGAKGGAGTTTVAVNCAVEVARLSRRPTLIIDLKPGLGEVALFLGVRPRYSIVDAIDNLNRLDREFLKELVIKHKSGLEILAGSDNFDRPGVADGPAIEEMFRLLTKQYEYLVIDAGSQINACATAGLYASDQMFLIANPDVPSVRNAQRVLERVRDLGASGDRIRLLLNRAAEPYPIPPKQIESALGHSIHHMFPSDYKTVSTALNSGVPLSLAGDSEIAAQFDQFVRRALDPNAQSQTADGKKGLLNVDRIASLW
jgi:pilus assembly protein CpaE